MSAVEPAGYDSGVQDSGGEEDAQGLPSPSAGMTIDVLTMLIATPPGPAPLRQLARALDVPRSTLHRVLQTLEIKGMVVRLDEGYVVGKRALELVALVGAGDLPRLAGQAVEEIHERTGETVNVAIPQRGGMLVVAARESSSPLRLVTPVGTQDALHASALGKAYLSALSDLRLAEVLAQVELRPATPNTIVSKAKLADDLAAAAERGYAIDDQESIVGVRALGAPIRGRDGHAVGALAVAGPLERIDDAATEQIGPFLAEVAARLSAMLGSHALS